MAVYKRMRAFRLSGKSFAVQELRLRQGAVEIVFTGDIYPAQPESGQVFGAVFVGNGRLHAAPWNDFEKQSVRRFLKSDTIDTTFTRAVLRFTDSSEAAFGTSETEPLALGEAQSLADALEPRMLRETGLNLSARMAQAIVNAERPGLFIAEFSGGDHRRFGLIFDHQCRSIENIFQLDAGEKGVLYQNKGADEGNDIWMAFYDDQDLERHAVAYSDTFNQVKIPNYRMNIDLRDAPHRLSIDSEMELVALRDNVRLVDLKLNEDLETSEYSRSKKGARVLSASLLDGTPVKYIQDEWDKAVWVLLPQPINRGERLRLKLRFEAKNCFYSWQDAFHYPLVNASWYPRYGELQQSNFDLTFQHKLKTQVVSVGKIVDGPARRGDEMVTRWQTAEPVKMATFAIGPFGLYSEKIQIAARQIDVDYYGASSDYTTTAQGVPTSIKKDFMTAELGNTLKYFSAMFNDYPYLRLGAVFSPRSFGQGFPTLLLLPSRGTDHLWDFAFIAHECSHEWWGQMVGWRSYRDQWLSEGFADYSGVLYTGFRLKSKDEVELVKRMRQRLMDPPRTDLGLASGKLYEVGPLIYGRRLSSRHTVDAYDALIYNKGALVLRMLHFLMTDPNTGDGKPFFDLMKEFTNTYRDKLASTDDFFRIASAHFADSVIGKRFGIRNLDWFQSQWVYSTEMPSYTLEYHLEPRASGGTLLTGTVLQSGVNNNWFMPIRLVVELDNGQQAATVIAVHGPSTPVKIAIPDRVKHVDLDPDLWVLSQRTSTKKQ